MGRSCLRDWLGLVIARPAGEIISRRGNFVLKQLKCSPEASESLLDTGPNQWLLKCACLSGDFLLLALS